MLPLAVTLTAARLVVVAFVRTAFVAVALVNVPPVEEMRLRPVMF
jgi:hypothetical protein